MLDIKFIRENKDLVKEGARKKHIEVDIDRLLELDNKRRELLSEVEQKRAEQNQATEKISKSQDSDEKQSMISEMQSLKEELQNKEEELKQVTIDWQNLMVLVPNVPDISVPEGEDDNGNQEVRTWGDIPKFKFEPKSHIDLMLDKDMADFERGSKVAGFRGYFLKNDAVRLTFSIWQLAYEHFFKKGNFIPMITPSVVRKEAFMGTGYLPQGEDDLYKTQDETYLTGTSEVSVMSYYMEERLERSDLPKKFFAFSPCFRREAGSYGKDTKGLMRLHEFFKFEQVVLCEASHEKSVQFHEELTANSEEIMKTLNIPHRVVVNCGGDLGLGQVKKYDIEAWVPSENTYRETHSSSYFHDFQTRRLNIKYRDENGKMRYAHSLNNTAVATPRLLISLIENNQQADGSIVVPEALRGYMGKEVIK